VAVACFGFFICTTIDTIKIGGGSNFRYILMILHGSLCLALAGESARECFSNQFCFCFVQSKAISSSGSTTATRFSSVPVNVEAEVAIVLVVNVVLERTSTK
jgi:hypothetical protein